MNFFKKLFKKRDRNWVPDYDFEVGRVEFRIEIDHVVDGSSMNTKYRFYRDGKQSKLPKAVAVGILEMVKNDLVS